ncbi:MAG: multidrug RND transporter, partial [Thermococcus sp.]
MAWNDWIARHPKTVLAVWVVLIVVLAPLAGKIGELTDYSTEQMVSHKIESIKVQDIVSEEFTGAQNENMTYLIVTNISVNDENARKAYYAFKDRVEGRYATNVTSYYDALDMLWDMDYNLTLNITRMTANVTGILYETVKGVHDGYGMVLNQTLLLKNTTEMVRESLVETAGAYLALKANMTALYTQLNSTATLLRAADGAYLKICSQNPNMTTQEKVQALQSALENQVPENQREIVPIIAQTVVSVDPYCKGTLLSNDELLRNTTVELVYGMVSKMGLELPKEVLFQLYDSKGNEAVIDAL